MEVEQNAFDWQGNDAVYLTRKIPLHNQEGLIVGILGISIDITTRKLDEQILLLAKEKAEAASRAKTEFLANMSHDMVSPLSGMLIAADAIISNDRALKEDRQMASIIFAAGKQLKSFFTSCLDLSKLEMEHWLSRTSIFSITQLVKDIQDLYLPKAMENKLSLFVECAPNLPDAVEGHYDALYRALLNLTGNALKFTKAGRVTVRAFCTDGPDDQHSMIHLQVQDTGMGIPQDKYEVIFEKLQRLTPAYSSNIEGSGIGLYIVDQFVKRMGGTIQVESEVGRGSTFTVLVPLRLAKIAETTKHKPVSAIPPEFGAPAMTIA